MVRRFLPLALLLLSGCASTGMNAAGGYYGESPTIASNDCRINELGWWEGRLNKCSWYPFTEQKDD